MSGKHRGAGGTGGGGANRGSAVSVRIDRYFGNCS
jgi:hypothetical protein